LKKKSNDFFTSGKICSGFPENFGSLRMKETGNKEGFVTLKTGWEKAAQNFRGQALHLQQKTRRQNPPPFSSLHRSTRNDFLELTTQICHGWCEGCGFRMATVRWKKL
jgi:hypothetical protein